MAGLHLIKRPRGLGMGALMLGAALLSSGCGAAKRGTNADVIQGKVDFVSKCGT